MLKQFLKFLISTPEYNPPQTRDEIPPAKEEPKQPTKAEIRDEKIKNKVLALLDKYPAYEWTEGEVVRDDYGYQKSVRLSHKDIDINLCATKQLPYGSAHWSICSIWPDGMEIHPGFRIADQIMIKWCQQIYEKNERDKQQAAQKFLDLEL